MLKRILPLLLVLVIMLAGCGKSDADTPNNTYEKITMSEGLARMESDENYILLDVAEPMNLKRDISPVQLIFPTKKSVQKKFPPCRTKHRLFIFIAEAGIAVSRRQISFWRWDIRT